MQRLFNQQMVRAGIMKYPRGGRDPSAAHVSGAARQARRAPVSTGRAPRVQLRRDPPPVAAASTGEHLR
jgi:hypothetical protein